MRDDSQHLKGRKILDNFMADWDKENGWHGHPRYNREELSRKRIAEFCRLRGAVIPGFAAPPQDREQ